MSSRVERYYDKDVNTKKRSVKNAELYRSIYDDETYSNIEGVVETTKTNEIDIKKIKELLFKQEEEEKKKNQLVRRDIEIPEMDTLDDDTQTGNYDIRDVLNKAKANQDNEDNNKLRSLKDIDFDDIKKRLAVAEKYTEEEQDNDMEELKNILNTISGNSINLNNLADKDLSLDMFNDLVGSTKDLTKDQTDAIKKIIAEAKKNEGNNAIDTDEIPELDKSFYTNTLKLKKKDFESDEEEEETHIGIKILIIIFFIILAVIFVFVGYKLLK